MYQRETRGEEWVKAWRLIFGQEDNSVGPLETVAALCNVDFEYAEGHLTAADLAALRKILATSPILRRPEFQQATVEAREDGDYDPAVHWWWWPERLWPGVAPKPFTLADYIREYGEEG